MFEEKNVEMFHIRKSNTNCDGISKWELRKLSQQMEIILEKFSQKGDEKD